MEPIKGRDAGDEFFKIVMQDLGVTPTDEKMRFFKAWQRAENTAALNNPLATKWPGSTKKTWDKDPEMITFGNENVKSYSKGKYGVQATVETLQQSGRYNCIKSKLRQDNITAEELAKCYSDLALWSGGDGHYVENTLNSRIFNIINSNNGTSTDAVANGDDVTNWNDIQDVLLQKYLATQIGDAMKFSSNDTQYTLYNGGKAFVTDDTGTNKTTYVLKQNNNQYSLYVGNTLVDPAVTDAEQAAGEEDWGFMDWFQLILDFLGFIPGYGDVIDIVNAIIYFIRQKWLDGILSLIAIIPVAGSAIKFGVKGSLKGVNKLLAKSGKSVEKEIAYAIKTGDFKSVRELFEKNLSAQQLRQMSEAADSAAKFLLQSKKKLKELHGSSAAMQKFVDPQQMKIILDQFDKVADIMRGVLKQEKELKNLKKIDQSTSFLKTLEGSAVGKVVIGTLALPIYPAKKLLQLFKVWDTKSIKNLSAGLSRSFAKKLQASPILTAQMMKANGKIPEGIMELLIKAQPYGLDTAADITKRYLSKNPGMLSTTQITKMLDQIRNRGKDGQKIYNNIAKDVAGSSRHLDNIYYKKYVADELFKASQSLKPGSTFAGTVDGNILNIFTNMQWGPKTADVVWNELQGAVDMIGFEDYLPEGSDPNQSLLTALLTSIFHYDKQTATKSVEDIGDYWTSDGNEESSGDE